jgi:hypothetical protein
MEWWWTKNPFCREDSPGGFLLRNESGRIVGFQGFIPLDYEIEGNLVPGLLSCLFFVEKAYRAQSLGLFFRMQRLSRQFHLVDGGPSADMVKILTRFHYEKGGTRTFYFLPCGVPSLRRAPNGCSLVTELDSIREVVTRCDDRLRRRVTPESLEWLLEVGRHPRQFLGAVDADDRLIAYAIASHRRLPGGLSGLQIIDYGSADESVFSVKDLLNQFRRPQGRRRLSPAPHLFLWGIENGAKHPRTFLRKEKPSQVFYLRPEASPQVEKVILPIEGDFSFF